MTDVFLGPADVEGLRDLAATGFRTRLALFGAFWAVLTRQNPDTGEWTALRPQETLLERANVQERTSTSESAAAIDVIGYLSKLGPFDVRAGDRFSVPQDGSMLPAQIITVEPEQLGVRRAGFRMLES